MVISAVVAAGTILFPARFLKPTDVKRTRTRTPARRAQRDSVRKITNTVFEYNKLSHNTSTESKC